MMKEDTNLPVNVIRHARREMYGHLLNLEIITT